MHPQCVCVWVLAEGYTCGARKEGHWEGNPWLIPWGRKCQLTLPSSTWWGIGDSDQEKGCALSHTEGLSCLQVPLQKPCWHLGFMHTWECSLCFNASFPRACC